MPEPPHRRKPGTLHPDHAGTQFELGRIAMHEHHYQAALRYLSRAAGLDPRAKQTSFLLATTLQKLGRAEEARAEFQRSRRPSNFY